MPSIGPSVFILGVVMVTVIVAQTSPPNKTDSNMTSTAKTSHSTIAITLSTTPGPYSATSKSFNNSTSDETTISSNTSSITPLTTQRGNESSKAPTTQMATLKSSTSKSVMTSTIKDPSTIDMVKDTKDNTGIIILVVIIIAFAVFGLACFFAKRRGRRQSVDFNSRPDEANIPLSTISPEMPADTAPQNGLQTFQSTESNAKEAAEPEAKPLVQEEQKAETDKSVGDPSAESADSSGDKPKEDVAEKSPPAPVEPNAEEKTDDEGIVSNKTSVESLKETNENNSNNADVTQKKDLKLTGVFWEVSLDSLV